MSDTPPDQKEEAGAPDGSKNPWVSWLMWVVLAPLMYVLSVGPAWWLHKKGYLPEKFGLVYQPFTYLPDNIERLIERYMRWWTP